MFWTLDFLTAIPAPQKPSLIALKMKPLPNRCRAVLRALHNLLREPYLLAPPGAVAIT
jgi:hypothetical protein